MMKIAIIGYGNLGRGVEAALLKAPDMEVVGIFSRRNPAEVKSIAGPVYPIERITEFYQQIDVGILCGGSATDLPEQTPHFANHFHVVDSFDTHAAIPEHFSKVDTIAKQAEKCAIISSGWDPGLFSIQRLIASSILPGGLTETFWGKGVSQGHSDAIRRIPGVIDATQYTIPQESVLEKIKSGEKLQLSAGDKHRRECFVVVDEEADPAKIQQEIIQMPNYFSEYETTVHFISQTELNDKHKKMAHGGTVIHLGETTEENKQVMQFSLTLDSNPEFTGSVLVGYARACYRLATEEKRTGAFTVFDIAPKYLSTLSDEAMRKQLL